MSLPSLSEKRMTVSLLCIDAHVIYQVQHFSFVSFCVVQFCAISRMCECPGVSHKMTIEDCFEEKTYYDFLHLLHIEMMCASKSVKC